MTDRLNNNHTTFTSNDRIAAPPSSERPLTPTTHTTFNPFEGANLPKLPHPHLASPEVAKKARLVLEDIITVLPFTNQERERLREAFPPIVTSETTTSYFRRERQDGTPTVIAIHANHEQDLPTYYEEVGHYVREHMMPLERDLESEPRFVRMCNRQDSLRRWLPPVAALFRRRVEAKCDATLNRITQVREFFGCLMRGLSPDGGMRDADRINASIDAVINGEGLRFASTKADNAATLLYQAQGHINSAETNWENEKKWREVTGNSLRDVRDPKTIPNLPNIKEAIKNHAEGYLAAACRSSELLTTPEGLQKFVDWLTMPSSFVYRVMLSKTERLMHEARMMSGKDPHRSFQQTLAAIKAMKAEFRA